MQFAKSLPGAIHYSVILGKHAHTLSDATQASIQQMAAIKTHTECKIQQQVSPVTLLLVWLKKKLNDLTYVG